MVTICSLNVNGLKASIGHGLLNALKQISADCVCLQETKIQQGKEPMILPGYHAFWSCSVARKGYSGTALFTRKEPVHVTYGIGDPEFDVEGRCITAEFDDFFLVNVYVPTSGDGLFRLDFRQGWDTQLRKYLSSLQSVKPVIVCGDLNVAITENDLFLGERVLRSAGVTEEEREGFRLLEGLGFVDTWRHLHPDEIGYSWWSYGMGKAYNYGWRLDYFLCSEPLMDNVVSCDMLQDVTVSDHCPIILRISNNL